MGQQQRSRRKLNARYGGIELKVLVKLFYALAVIAMLATTVGFFWALWINATLGIKAMVTAMFSALIFASVGESLDH